ncbi:MAG TPA: VOC family protein [Propionicimonas sp.]|uniref:VOC family protein n=1 Tax=Propionicimonas sp. TaxID=1955623 RepID=UPI002F3ECCE5
MACAPSCQTEERGFWYGHPLQERAQTMVDVDGEYARLMGLGVSSVQEPETQPWGQRNFWIADPEGNYIEVGSFSAR